MSHLVLLGDGILANRAHTNKEPDTATIIGQQLPGWTVTLLAEEGSAMAAIATQLRRLPANPDLVVLSVGGNDAMGHVDLLQQPAKSSGETLDALIKMVDGFAEKYEGVVQSVRTRAPRVVLCTIYEPPLVGQNTASRARVLLTLLNDRILRTAYRGGMDVLDLRAICTKPDDFRLQIEPSASGAAKIGRAIAAVAAGTEGRRVTIIAG